MSRTLPAHYPHQTDHFNEMPGDNGAPPRALRVDVRAT
jgi:hypothetical protein